MPNNLEPNFGKNLVVEVNGQKYARLPIKTHIITSEDNIIDVCGKYVAGGSEAKALLPPKPYLQKDDLLFISERIVAISQGRAFKIKDIQPSWLAKFLVKFVHKSPYGIGLGSPWTMELAIREAGIARVIFAALVSSVTKPFGVKGIFYKVVGKNINAIDGPCSYTLPPYNEYAKLGPANPQKVAKEIRNKIGVEVVIIDANDLGVAVLGKSSENISDDFCKNVFQDNPLGQSSEQTPLCVVRRVL